MTDVEQAFADQMEKDGWELHKNGFPDFLCLKDERATLVEVKANKDDRLKEHQFKMATLLTAHGLPTFVWSPDVAEIIPFEIFQKQADKLNKKLILKLIKILRNRQKILTKRPKNTILVPREIKTKLPTSTKTDTRVCASCRKLFEVKGRSYQRFCDDCLTKIFSEAGKRGGRPKKAKAQA